MTIHQNGVVIKADQMARLDFALKTGSKSGRITVLGSAPLLNISDASVSTRIGNRFVENMPGALAPSSIWRRGWC
jgi:hypothetical protein